MSGNECEALESGELQAVRDLKLGVRARRTWATILVHAKDAGLTEQQVRGFVNGGGLFAADAERQTLASGLGFDWSGAAGFFAKIAPVILQMMAACGA